MLHRSLALLACVVVFATATSQTYAQSPSTRSQNVVRASSNHLAGEQVGGLTLAMVIPKKTITAGESPTVTIEVRNASGREVRALPIYVYSNVRITAIEVSTGAILPQPSDVPTNGAGFISPRSHGLAVPATNSLYVSFPLAEKMDVNRPGTYNITADVSFYRPDLGQRTALKSNTVQITIVK